jgi:hypothetical protein
VLSAPNCDLRCVVCLSRALCAPRSRSSSSGAPPGAVPVQSDGSAYRNAMSVVDPAPEPQDAEDAAQEDAAGCT